MRIELFDYELPDELIAQEPVPERSASRLMVVDRGAAAPSLEHRFADLPGLLRRGDLLVLNDALVDPVRLYTRRATGGAVEVLLLHPAPAAPGAKGAVWEAMMRPAKRLRDGERLVLGEAGAQLIVHGSTGEGRRLVELPDGAARGDFLATWGHMPLPPYIRRGPQDAREALDRDRYQTVYASVRGAVAAPTAGLHFTDPLLKELRAAGVGVATLTLRVGPGTFAPVRAGELEQHRMEAEAYTLPPASVAAIVAAKQAGGRIVAVGTTVVRTLEHAARAAGGIEHAAGEGEADIFIYPGYRFDVVDAMVTNFHLPRSTPILLAAALAGRERLLAAYGLAVRSGFRFYSYGDAMLIH